MRMIVRGLLKSIAALVFATVCAVSALAQTFSIAWEGDSILYGATCAWYQYFNVSSSIVPATDAGRQAMRYSKSSPTIIGTNFSITGTRLTTGSNPLATRASAPGGIDFLIPSPKRNPLARSQAPGSLARALTARKYILAVMAGTNPDSSDPAALAANMATYVAARKAAGWDYVLVGTLPSRTDGIIANFDTTYQQPYNTIIRGAAWQATNRVDGLIDFAANSNLGAAAAADNATYFSDKIHFTAGAGCTEALGVLQPAIDNFIASHLNFNLRRDLGAPANDNRPAFIDLAA